MIRRFLVIGNDEDAPLVAKLVLVRALLDHPPGEASIGRQEGIAVLYAISVLAVHAER